MKKEIGLLIFQNIITEQWGLYRKVSSYRIQKILDENGKKILVCPDIFSCLASKIIDVMYKCQIILCSNGTSLSTCKQRNDKEKNVKCWVQGPDSNFEED